MFELTRQESDALEASRSQFVTLKRGQNLKYAPHAFAEQGVAMLSSVLRSAHAVEVNIAIMRTYDERFAIVFDAIKGLIADDTAGRTAPRRRIGFVTD